MPEVFPKGTTLVTYTGTRPIMRVPMSGGAPQQVLAAPLILSHRCAARANVCVTSEIPAGRNQLVFTAFDPVQGRGRELARFESDPKGSYSWDLSSDGTRIAIHKGREGQIDVLSLAGGAPQQIQVKNWASHQGVDWTFDAKGLFIGNKVPGGTELLYTDLQGNTRMVWRQPHGIRSSGVPSPDGRHLAMLGWVERSGMWMIEGF
jgi:hypothetical protein